MDEQEKAAEQAAQAEVKEEEVRASIITEYGFDEVDDAERIDKLVKKDIEGRQKLSAAIGQKIKYRTEAETLKQTPKPVEQTNGVAPEDIDKRLEEKLQQRDLDEMDYPDHIKTEIKRIAAITNKTVKQAARDPYIISTQIEPWEKAQKADEASISRTNRSGSKKSYSLESPPDVDMSTPEGRKEWDAYLDAMKKGGN